MPSDIDPHLEHRRNIIRSIAAGKDSFEDAVRLVRQNPMLTPVLESPKVFKPMFTPDGTGGVLAICSVDASMLVELAYEKTRATADFSDLIFAARTDYYLFTGLKELAIEDLRRRGQPNVDLRRFLADLLDGSFSKPSKPSSGKTRHLAWRDVLIVSLFADASVFSQFPLNKNTKPLPGREKKAACDIVIAALADVILLSPQLVEDIWKKNRHRVTWHLPEIPENL